MAITSKTGTTSNFANKPKDTKKETTSPKTDSNKAVQDKNNSIQNEDVKKTETQSNETNSTTEKASDFKTVTQNMENVLENEDVLKIFDEDEENKEESPIDVSYTIEPTKEFLGNFQVDSVDEFKTLVQDLDLTVDIDYQRLSDGNYNEYELDEITQAVAIALETTTTDTSDFQLNDTETNRYLNEKYNLGINFEAGNSNLTPEQLDLYTKAYITDIQNSNINATRQNMLKYFDTLGIIDKTYDGVKNVLEFGLTEEKVSEYCNNEQKKNDFLAKIVQNGGNISLLDDNTKKELTDIIKYNSNNMSKEEFEQYAINRLNVKEEDIKAFKQNHPEFFNKFGGVLVDENMNSASDSEIRKAFIEDLFNGQKFENLSYEEAYGIINNTDYNPQLIANIINSQEVYSTIAKEQQNAYALEEVLSTASPKEALEYFNVLAQNSPNGKTGEELLNEYYENLFNKYPEKFSKTDQSGAKCIGISVKDGYLWQELSYPDGSDMSLYEQGEFLYKKTDENGVERYYKVVNLENEKEVLSNMSGKDETYQMFFFGNRFEDPTYSNNPLALFYNTNDTITENNLYLNNIKDNFDKEYGENAFDAILDKYPKMYEEAFGKNILKQQLSDYMEDMDTYSRNLSLAMCFGCLAAACSGVAVPMSVGVISTFSDNFINGVNIDTSNSSAKEKHRLRKQLMADTLIEGGIFTMGTAANIVFQDADIDFILNYKDALGATSEYAIESGSDTSDFIRTMFA